ncbi:MAG TPA: hydrogenase formation protein HypD [Phycisphaeraceae bacterium]|nr:hydrogenase formation protein HypD [Phycisphaeraceae bacterium]
MSLRGQMLRLVEDLRRTANTIGRPVSFMEICGTHTVNACRSGVHSLMPKNVRLISGPGCPVCVTAQRYIDALIELGKRPEVTLTTYGDMMRVTGEGGSLELSRSEGADVRVVTSTMDAVEIARNHPDRQVVFAAVGFETTAPATAAAVLAADRLNLDNFSILAAHKLVIPAMHTLLSDPDLRIDGFLCPGHVSVIIGSNAYLPIVDQYHKPCVIAGFEPIQIMEGIYHLAEQVIRDEAKLENLYAEAVQPQGNPVARQLLDKVFVPGDAAWRALGVMGESGLDLRPEYSRFDAVKRFEIELGEDHEPPGCRCGEVITGQVSPDECKLFGTVCTPINPIGPCMVSSEGSCQAWFKYRRNEIKRQHSRERQHEEVIA